QPLERLRLGVDVRPRQFSEFSNEIPVTLGREKWTGLEHERKQNELQVFCTGGGQPSEIVSAERFGLGGGRRAQGQGRIRPPASARPITALPPPSVRGRRSHRAPPGAGRALPAP